MSETKHIAVIGAAGRMGRMILECAATSEEPFNLVAAIEAPGHPMLGREVSSFVPAVSAAVTLSDSFPEEFPPGMVTIDFTAPANTLERLEWNASKGVGAVIGTTGFEGKDLEQIGKLAGQSPILLAPNMSVGVNVMFALLAEGLKMLGEDFDVEITEIHHRFKKDAPSGTARRLAEIVLEARGGDEASALRHGRHGMPGERTREEVGMHSLRGGDVVGDHSVIFAGLGERIELTHRAQSRDIYARGALRAAAWISGRAPGLYTMKDVLGL